MGDSLLLSVFVMVIAVGALAFASWWVHDTRKHLSFERAMAYKARERANSQADKALMSEREAKRHTITELLEHGADPDDVMDFMGRKRLGGQPPDHTPAVEEGGIPPAVAAFLGLIIKAVKSATPAVQAKAQETLDELGVELDPALALQLEEVGERAAESSQPSEDGVG